MPRSEASEAVSKISELEWFHPIKQDSKYTNPDIADLLLRAQKTFQSIDDIVRTLDISVEVGIMETMFKGTPKFDTKFTIDSIEELVDKIESEAKPIIDELTSIIEEHDKVKKELDENSTLLEAVKVVSNISIQLDKLNRFKHFYAAMFVVDTKDVDEIVRSLEGISVIRIPLNEENTALITIGTKEDAEKIIKVLRSFDKQPFTIPPTLPQKPSEAFALLSNKVEDLKKRKEELEDTITKLKANVRTKITSLHEASRVAKDVLDIMRKPAGTKNFAVIQGYVPSKMEGKLRKLSKKWVCITEDPDNSNEHNKIPVLLNNPTYIKTFEAVTETQGIPKHKEIDPTPIIAFVWPIFYGLMFGDLGHGILLFLLGMLFRVRGLGNLRRWGTLVAASGVGSAVAGLGTGEFFGFHIEEFGILHAIFAPLIDAHIIGIMSVAELSFEQVARVLEISIAVGIGHIAMAFILKIIKDFKEGNKIEGGMVGIPTLIMYGAVVS
ncbi:MAG: ATPase, partial [Candidatus Nitrosothermus koennekii]